MQVNDDNTVDKLSILYIYATGKTERTMELANITLSSPLSFYSVLDNSASDVKFTVNRKTVFEFDTKYNYDNQEITNALYASENKTSDLKLISEAETDSKISVAYNYVVVNKGNIDSYKIEVDKGDGSVENILYNLQQGRKTDAVNTGSYHMNGTIIYSEGTYEK